MDLFEIDVPHDEAGAQEERPVYSQPMEILPPGPCRSLGRVLDYTSWGDRERFVELDALLARHNDREDRRNHRGRAAALPKAA